MSVYDNERIALGKAQQDKANVVLAKAKAEGLANRAKIEPSSIRKTTRQRT